MAQVCFNIYIYIYLFFLELAYSVQHIIRETGIPLEFEEVFLSEIHYTQSAKIEDVIKSISRNNNVALKGVIQDGLDGENHGLNMQLRRSLDLFANVVHIEVKNK